MNSLVFLITRTAKNQVLEVLRKPAKLIIWSVALAGIIAVLIISLFTRQTVDEYMPLSYLKGIIFAFILLFFVLSIQKGLSKGDVIFDMSDVNLLFVSPIDSRPILLYGVTRMASMAFLAGFFILFQSNTFSMFFNLGFDAVLLTLFGFILAVSMMQIVSLLIYSLTNGRPRRQLVVRIIAVAIFLPLLAQLVLGYMQAGEPMAALSLVLESPVLSWTPVAGWAAQMVLGFITGNLMEGLLFLGVILLSTAVLIAVIILCNPDYYEDVLVATETAFEKKRAMTENPTGTEALGNKKVKVARSGISGQGASTLFRKHLRESFRANRFGLWGIQSLLVVGGSIAFALFIKGMDGDGDDGGEAVLILLQALMWTQMFLVGTGRGLKELYSHYIYLIPESSFRKIVWSNIELVFKAFVECLLLFTAAGIIMQAPPLLIVAAIAVYSLFTLLLIGINYLSMRLTGASISMGLLMAIYIFAVLIIMAPGVVAAMIIGFSIAGIGPFLGLLVLAAWELLAAAACFALSKGILHNCDMPTIAPKG
jgi:hypothetical protein